MLLRAPSAAKATGIRYSRSSIGPSLDIKRELSKFRPSISVSFIPRSPLSFFSKFSTWNQFREWFATNFYLTFLGSKNMPPPSPTPYVPTCFLERRVCVRFRCLLTRSSRSSVPEPRPPRHPKLFNTHGIEYFDDFYWLQNLSDEVRSLILTLLTIYWIDFTTVHAEVFVGRKTVIEEYFRLNGSR